MSSIIKKAVFPVAGMGTRFLPATKSMPKEMLPIVDKPLIQYAVEEAFDAGIEEIIFVTGRGKTAIEDHFDRSFELESLLKSKKDNHKLSEIIETFPSKKGNISYTRQREPLGLGHAILCSRALVGNEPFAVLLADDVFKCKTPCLKQMVTQYEKIGGNIVAVMEVTKKNTSKYGILEEGEKNGPMVEIKGLVEKPTPEEAPSTSAISGRYILQPEIFDYLEKKVIGAGGEIQLTDAMAQLIGQQPFNGFFFEGERFDCGDKIGFLRANIAFALERETMNKELKRILLEYSKK